MTSTIKAFFQGVPLGELLRGEPLPICLLVTFNDEDGKSWPGTHHQQSQHVGQLAQRRTLLAGASSWRTGFKHQENDRKMAFSLLP